MSAEAHTIAADGQIALACFELGGRSFGIEVHGVEARALVDYSTSVRWRNRGREVLARLRACVDVYL